MLTTFLKLLLNTVANCFQTADHHISLENISVREIRFMYMKLHLHLPYSRKNLKPHEVEAYEEVNCVSPGTQIPAQFWEGAWREVAECWPAWCWLCAISQNHGPCSRAWIFCGFHPINLEQLHWTLFLASAFHFQVDNWMKLSLACWALAQSSKAMLMVLLSVNYRMELALVTLRLSLSRSWAPVWKQFTHIPAQVME